MAIEERFPGVFFDGDSYYTENSSPGTQVYGERLIKVKGREYRQWDPRRSKLCAALHKGLNVFPISENDVVLYLGAASGTTVSHITDITKKEVYAIEFAERPFRDLIKVAEKRANLMPVLANARQPKEYSAIVPEVDVVYQDIAQRDQVDIFLKNMGYFNAKRGVLMLKARSVDVSKKPKEVFQEVADKLSEYTKILQAIKLKPYEKDHMAFIVKA
jgi:fibrillarin-like pre-rRNA processing protein